MANIGIEKLNDIANSNAAISINSVGEGRYIAKITLYIHKHNGSIKVRHATIHGTTDRVQVINRKVVFKSDRVYVRFTWDKLRQTKSLTVHEVEHEV